MVLRYFDGLPPREICTRLGLTSAAARSRPSRALARLRERLDRSFEGGRRAWMAMLVPVGAPAGGHAALEPALLAPLVLGGLALTAVSLVVVLKATRSSDDPETTASPARAAAVLSNDAPAEDSRSSGAAAPAESPRERVAVATEAAPSGTAPAAAHEASWTLVARFVDETGAALVGVRLNPADGSDWSGTSDATGALRIALPWPYTGSTVDGGGLGGHVVSVEAGGHRLATRSWHVTMEGPGEQSLGEIRMGPGGTLLGRVIDEDGRPLAGATVVATGGHAPETADGLDEARTLKSNVHWLEDGLQGSTGADGRFELAGAPATHVAALASTLGRLSGFSSVFDLAPGQTVDVGAIVLERPPPANRITGTVREADGKPAPHVRIEFSERDPRGGEGIHGSTDDDGAFELVVPRGREFTLLFSRYATPLVLTDVASGTLGLEVRLPAERWIEIVARDERGDAVPVTRVNVHDASGLTLTPSREDRPDGRVRLRVPGMPFRVQAITPGWKSAPQGPLDPASAPAELVFRVERAAGLAGRVLADGEPVAGARVHAHWAWDEGGISDDGFHTRVVAWHIKETGVTDAEGAFRIPITQGGAIVLHAELDGGARAELGPLEVAEGVEQLGLELELERGGTLEGRLLAAEGVEVRGKIVGVGCGEGHVPIRELGADGSFRFEHLRPGSYQVLTCDPGSLGRLQKGLYMVPDPADPVAWSTTVRAGEVTHFDLDQRDRIPSSLSGELRLDGRAPVSWRASIGVEDGGSIGSKGRFELRVARPGAYGLYLSGDAGPALVRMHQELELAPGANTWTRDLPTGTVTLTHVPAFERREEGGAPPAYVLEWRDDPALVWQGRLYHPPDASGVLTIPTVPAGRVRLLRCPPDADAGDPGEDWPVVRELELRAGTEERIELP